MILNYGGVDSDRISITYEPTKVNAEFIEEGTYAGIIKEARNSIRESDEGVNWPAFNRTMGTAKRKLKNKGPGVEVAFSFLTKNYLLFELITYASYIKKKLIFF